MQQVSEPARLTDSYLGSLDVGRRVDVDQLVGATDIAERLGFARSQDVHHWRRRDPGFPEPVTVLGGGPRKGIYVWAWPDVAAWARKKGFTLAEGEWTPPPRSKSARDRQSELEALQRELANLAGLREQLSEVATLRERLEAIERREPPAPGPAD